MKVVLIEDEIPAIEKLERYLLKYDPTFEVVAKLSSIDASVKWFKAHENDFDVVFMDIQLTDGISFEIFNYTTIQKPVIFITAFDEYALDAFKVNSIDYLLKPITFTDVSKALHKLKNLKTVLAINPVISQVVQQINEQKFKDRFLVRLGNHIHSIKTEEIALFYADGRTVYLVTNERKKFIVDYNLETLCGLLDQREFFRVNRSFLIAINAIKDVVVYSNSLLNVTPIVPVEKEIVVSREKVHGFKDWLEGVK